MIRVEPFFHQDTSTFTYVVFDELTRDALIIDPVLDFDPISAKISDDSLQIIYSFIVENKLQTQLVLDTHIHADHLTGSYIAKKHLGVKSAIGRGFLLSQAYFSLLYQIDPSAFEPAYDDYFSHQEERLCGSLKITTLFTPGHTPTCSSYLIGDRLFVGDVLFNPSLGCGRTDFPGGSAEDLYEAVDQQIFTLPDDIRILVGHDYPSENNLPLCQSTVLEQKHHNVMLNRNLTKAEFIAKREDRDQNLALPRLFFYAMQINLLGGQLPKDNFLKIPITHA